ncbi:MAG: outer membrane beta-barrel protein [Alistipes finegoldii]
MKKIIIVLLAAAASFTAADKASAQEKGLWIGGKLGYWHDKTEVVTTDSFSITPEAGYDFNKRWSVGVALGYEYLKVKDGGSANVFTASPYARYKYYNKGILSLFLDGGVGFACCDHEGFQAGITPGLSVKINEHFSLPDAGRLPRLPQGLLQRRQRRGLRPETLLVRSEIRILLQILTDNEDIHAAPVPLARRFFDNKNPLHIRACPSDLGRRFTVRSTRSTQTSWKAPPPRA